jgi:hypothetical protein
MTIVLSILDVSFAALSKARLVVLWAVLGAVSIACPVVVAKMNRDRHIDIADRKVRALQAGLAAVFRRTKWCK